MALGFNFGKTKQSSQSSSVDLGFGRQESVSESLQDAVSGAVSGGAATSRQDIAFADIFQSLFSGAAGTASQLSGAPVRSAAETLFSSGTQFLEQLQGGGEGADFLRERLSSESPLVNEQIDRLGEDIGRFTREELLPGVRRSAVAGGGLGGGRQGIAEGQITDSAIDQFQRGAIDIRSRDLFARDQAATSLAGLEAGTAGTGLSSLSGLLDLQERGELAELSPFMALAQILGGPTTLTESSSENFSEQFSESISRAFSEAFGEDFRFGTSQSTSKGKSFNFGLGV